MKKLFCRSLYTININVNCEICVKENILFHFVSESIIIAFIHPSLTNLTYPFDILHKHLIHINDNQFLNIHYNHFFVFLDV